MAIIKIQIHCKEGNVSNGIGISESLVKLYAVKYIDAICYTDMLRMNISMTVFYKALLHSSHKQPMPCLEKVLRTIFYCIKLCLGNCPSYEAMGLIKIFLRIFLYYG